jgi:hypothetical protein
MRGPGWVCGTSRLVVEELELRGIVVDVSALREGEEDGKANDGVVELEFEVGADAIGEASLRDLLAARLLLAGWELEFGVGLRVELEIALEFARGD